MYTLSATMTSPPINPGQQRYNSVPLAVALLGLLLAMTQLLPLAMAEEGDTQFSLRDTSLEDLMHVEVVTASKRPQSISKVPAAMSVITAEDIRQSGATEFPEVLMMVPGVDVVKVSANHWAVTIRGGARRISNKLLVMIDGRNALDPVFSGVNWEGLGFSIDDIERVEIIRGSGASTWGVNAVNGVINIITKSAAATQTSTVVVGGGWQQYLRGKFGGANADQSVFYRGYVSDFHSNPNQNLSGGSAKDAFFKHSAGFRLDGYNRDGGKWDFAADAYVSDGTSWISMIEGQDDLARFKEQSKGFSLRGHSEWVLANGSAMQLNASYVRLDIGTGWLSPAIQPQRIVDVTENIFDTDIQNRVYVGHGHDISWGASVRVVDDHIKSGQVIVKKPEATMVYSSLYAMDEITLNDKLLLSLGARMDHNQYTGWEYSPNLGLVWNLHSDHVLWGKLARAVRVPRRFDQDIELGVEYKPAQGGLPPSATIVRSDGGLKSEYLNSAELGWRAQWNSKLHSNINVFSNQYTSLSSFTFDRTDASTLPTQGYVTNYVSPGNKGELRTVGAELSVDWRLLHDWHLQFSQTLNHVVSETNQADEAALIPTSITFLRTTWEPTARFSTSMDIRRISERDSTSGSSYYSRPGYTTVDMRMRWKPVKNIELSLNARSLNNGMCNAYEGRGVMLDQGTRMWMLCTPRSLVGEIRWDF
ncbi:TonB-dependent receptor plug domain-containing protein [Methylophilus luteus]|uniref:TonB-dependent receptor plug domain-containing protein n=1 Tax=Methylophilus luteus TaxID=640108 RepID=A0ABW3F9Y7_9PROT